MMGFARRLLPVVALLTCGCGSYRVPGDSGFVADSSSTSGSGVSAGGASARDGTAAGGGSESPGGASAVPEELCEIVDDAQLLPEVMLPYDECEGQPNITPPTSPGACVFWTGEGYLTVFSDSRGVVVALLDESGVVLREEILSPQSVGYVRARFSKNRDRILIVLEPVLEDSAAVAVLDLRGVPLTPLTPLGGIGFNFAVTPSEYDWLVAFGYSNQSSGHRGILLSRVSGDGIVLKQQGIEVWGYAILDGFVPSGDQGVLLVGEYDTGGQFGALYRLVARVDRQLEAVSCAAVQSD